MTCRLCDRPTKARGLCNRHYQSERTAGRLELIQPHQPHTGRRTSNLGYVYVMRHGHPLADSLGYVAEHRLVMWDLGHLHPGNLDHHVHHINHVKDDNRPENLEVVSASDHCAHHSRHGATNQYGTYGRVADACHLCGRPAARGDLCTAHYSRLIRYGNPLTVHRVNRLTIEPYELA